MAQIHDIFAALSCPTKCEILAALINGRPRDSVEALAEAANITPGCASLALVKLRRLGLVDVQTNGRKRVVDLTPFGREVCSIGEMLAFAIKACAGEVPEVG